MKRITYIALLCFFYTICSITPARAQTTPTPPPQFDIRTQFVTESGATLEQLSAGGVGQGVILYYSADHDVNHPSLAVRLTKENGATTAHAEVYAAPEKATTFAWGKKDSRIEFEPPLIKSLSLVTLDGQWVVNGRPSYNIDVEVRGPIYGMWGASYDAERKVPSGWTALVKPKEVANTLEVRDPQHSGVPLSDWRTSSSSFAYRPSNYAERKCDTPLQYDAGVSPLWPYVAKLRRNVGLDGSVAYQTQSYEQVAGELRAPIVVDWTIGKVTHFSELVAVRNQNCSYAHYNLNPLEVGKLNHVDFESPFAFYDFSNQGKGYPNVLLRTEHYYAGDPESTGLIWSVQPGKVAPTDYETVRYSWRLAPGDRKWDYKVEVLGFKPYDFKTSLANGKLTINAPSYEQFPSWVVNNSWPVVTFIADEGHPGESSEGLYDWSPSDLGIGYIFGWTDHKNPITFSALTPGLRGEYRITSNTPPTLYMSPIDNRMHLLGAEAGVWNVLPNRAQHLRDVPLENYLALHTLHLGNSPYVNGWQLEQLSEQIVPPTDDTAPVEEDPTALPAAAKSGTLREALYALNGYLVYANATSVEIRHTNYTLHDDQSVPPTDNATWDAMRTKVATYQRRDPLDMKSWLEAFPATEKSTLTGAHLSDMRAVDNGFRFALRLDPTFHSDGLNLFGASGLTPGNYVITYTNGAFSVAPLTPPTISATFSVTTLFKQQQIPLSINFRNTGSTDVADAYLQVWAKNPKGDEFMIESRPVTLLGDTTSIETFQWAAPLVGQWTMTLKVFDRRQKNALITAPTQTLEVQQLAAAPPESILTSSLPIYGLPFAFIGLVLGMLMLGVFTGGVWAMFLKKGNTRDT